MLRPIAGIFNAADYPDLLVGLGHPDDAAVWRIDDERALVVTTDFFTPVVDDAFDYGAIAAANALSDVYAMGGQPFMALNIAALPPELPAEVLQDILRGGAEIAKEAGVVIAGGHTIQDKEPKYGLVVIGFANPQHILTKAGVRPGDQLVLSKPLGFGTITTALKQGLAAPEDVREVVHWMKQLNKNASELAIGSGLRAGTDITGFSLLGHALEMADASGVNLNFHFTSLPFIHSAHQYAQEFIFPGGASDNRLYYGSRVRFAETIREPEMMLLFDPQTSGGLLLAVPPERLEAFMQRSADLNQPMWIVGEALPGEGISVR